MQTGRKLTLQHVVTAGGGCWGYSILQRVGFSNTGLCCPAISRGPSVGADVGAGSCESGRWGSGQLRLPPTSVFNHPPGRGAFSPFSGHSWGGKERCRNQMVRWFARKVFPPGPDTLAKGCGDLGLWCAGRSRCCMRN